MTEPKYQTLMAKFSEGEEQTFLRKFKAALILKNISIKEWMTEKMKETLKEIEQEEKESK